MCLFICWGHVQIKHTVVNFISFWHHYGHAVNYTSALIWPFSPQTAELHRKTNGSSIPSWDFRTSNFVRAMQRRRRRPGARPVMSSRAAYRVLPPRYQLALATRSFGNTVMFRCCLGYAYSFGYGQPKRLGVMGLWGRRYERAGRGRRVNGISGGARDGRATSRHSCDCGAPPAQHMPARPSNISSR